MVKNATFVTPILPGRVVDQGPYAPDRSSCARRRPRATPSQITRILTPCMSGVNGGIDYDIDLSTLPSSLASQIRYVQQGPDSPTELIKAAKEIAANASAYPAVLYVLVDMLGFNNPVAAGIAIDALGNAQRAAIPALLTGVAAFNYAVNAYALRAIARIGDPSTFDVCTACAIRGPIPNVRRAACRALAALRFEESVTAAEAFARLVVLADTEPDWGVRYAAIVALERFHTLHLIEHSLANDALRVVRATSDGCSHVACLVEGVDKLPSPPELSVDPAVSARAAVAFSVLVERYNATNIPISFETVEEKVNASQQ